MSTDTRYDFSDTPSAGELAEDREKMTQSDCDHVSFKTTSDISTNAQDPIIGNRNGARGSCYVDSRVVSRLRSATPMMVPGIVVRSDCDTGLCYHISFPPQCALGQSGSGQMPRFAASSQEDRNIPLVHSVGTVR